MAHEGSELENEYGRLLRANRREKEENDLLETEMPEEKERPKDHTVTFVLAFIIAVFSDLADIVIIGSIPIIGDALDAVTGIALTALFLSIGGRKKFKRLLPSAVATLIEFLPFWITDVMPTYTIEVVITWFMVQKENRAQEQ